MSSGQPITCYTEVCKEYYGSDHSYPPPGVMFVYVDEGVPKLVEFMCPCGCNRLTPIHLTRPGKKRSDHDWDYSPGPTLQPSIRLLSGCMSHFTISNGKVTLTR